MSIRKKLIIAIIVTFVLNIAVLFIYYESSMSDRVSKLIEDIQVDLDNKLDIIYSDIKYKNSLKIEEILTDMDKVNYYVSIEDISGKKLYNYGEEKKGSIRATSVKLIDIDGQIYLIELKQMLPIDKLKNIPVTEEIIKVEMVILGIILLLLTFIMYVNFVKPLQYLQKDINNYKYGIKPTMTKRSDEIGWLKNKFVMLTEDLDEEKDKQNKIIASISHDIKTPLTSIMGYSERLKNTNLSDGRRGRYIDIIYSKSQNIKELIDEFDDYLSYNLESSVKRENISINNLIKMIREEFEDELNQLSVDFRINSDCDEENISIDISKIRRVIGNIVGNSIKHMNNDDKVIEISINKIYDKIRISVADNGCGVDEKEINHIFEALYTSDNSRKVAGLGLSICKKAIEGHQGEIWAENNKYGGLTVSFII